MEHVWFAHIVYHCLESQASPPSTGYGVRLREKCTFEDQLGLVPGTKSKIGDGSGTGTCYQLRGGNCGPRFPVCLPARAPAGPWISAPLGPDAPSLNAMQGGMMRPARTAASEHGIHIPLEGARLYSRGSRSLLDGLCRARAHQRVLHLHRRRLCTVPPSMCS